MLESVTCKKNREVHFYVYFDACFSSAAVNGASKLREGLYVPQTSIALPFAKGWLQQHYVHAIMSM